MMGSMFGAYAPPQGGGMFGQPQSPSMFGGGANPQLLQLAQQLMAAGGPSRMPAGATAMPTVPPMGTAPGMGQPAGMGMGQPQMGIAQLLQLLGGSR